MVELEKILDELEKKTKFSRKQLYEKVKKKQEELSGLVSQEGAAHLIAREFGLDLLKMKRSELKIKNITDGMRNLSFVARVIRVNPPREFERKNGLRGKVCNVLVADETAEIRVVLWDKQVDSLKNSGLKEGNIVRINNTTARRNPFGAVDIVLSKFSNVVKAEGEELPPLKDLGNVPAHSERKTIADAGEGFYEIRGSIVHIFDTNLVYQTCPKCNKKIEDDTCQEHGKIEPKANMLISSVIDDGTSNIRTVFFRELAEEASDVKVKMLSKMSQEEALDVIKGNMLGNEFVIGGRVQKNKIFGNLELIANNVKNLDVVDEAERMLGDIQKVR